MEYVYGVNPQTGRVELGANILGSWMPAAKLDPNRFAQPVQTTQQAPSPVNNMIQRAQQAAQNINVPTMQSLFPNLSMPTQAQGTPMGMPFTGGYNQNSFGAGRFLGSNPMASSNPMGGGLLGFNFSTPGK